MTSTNMKWRLDGKKTLITGASKGIGFATAQEFLELGAELIVTARNPEHLEACVKEWKAKGFKVFGFSSDVSKDEDRKALAGFVQKTWGCLDILVNNAGSNIRKPTMDYSEDEINFIFNTNLVSAFGLSRLLYPMLRESKSAAIVNVSSVAGLNHLRSGSPYGMTKAAMNQMTRNLAVEWAKDGIRVNAVAPGFTRTPLTEFWQANEVVMKELTARTPLQRMGEASEIAAAIAFLAMPSSSFTTGQCLVVDGGLLTNTI